MALDLEKPAKRVSIMILDVPIRESDLNIYTLGSFTLVDYQANDTEPVDWKSSNYFKLGDSAAE